MNRLLASVFPSTSFDVSYANYSRFLAFTDKHDHEATALAEALPLWLAPGDNVTAIDVGAGSGRLARSLCGIYGGGPGDFSLTLLEPATKAAETLEREFANQRGVTVACQSLQELASSSRRTKHSLVLASHVNYYFRDREEFFDIMLELLQPGGVLCCISGSISLIDHPFYRELGPAIWQMPGAERSFGLDGYGSCAEEMELVAFNRGHAFHSIRSPASLVCTAEQVQRALKALTSLDKCMEDDLCRCFGFLLRVPVEVIFRARQRVRDFLGRRGAAETGMRIDCEDKIMFLRTPGRR